MKCKVCEDTGYYGDNGPGIKGNREYQPCDQCPQLPGKYIRVINVEGDDCDVLCAKPWQERDPSWIAEQAARYDLDSGELDDPNQWPRDYRFYIDGKPCTIGVHLDWEPSFTSEVREYDKDQEQSEAASPESACSDGGIDDKD